MPRKRRSGRGPSLPPSLQQPNAPQTEGKKRSGKRKSRKEQRQLKRLAKKQRRNQQQPSKLATRPAAHNPAPPPVAITTTDTAKAIEQDPDNSNFFDLLKQQRLVQGGRAEDPEDAEIRRLEAKLGIRSSKGRNWKRVQKEYSADGLGEDFIDFLRDVDPSDGESEVEESALPPEWSESEGEISGMESEEEAVRAEVAAMAAGEEGGGESDGGSPNSSSDGEEAEEEEASDAEDIYGRRKKAAVVAAPTKYVPPHLRAAAAAAAAGGAKGGGAGGKVRSAAYQQLSRRVRGLVNRLSESNVEPLSAEIAELYRSHSSHDMNDALLAALLGACCDSGQILSSLVRVCAALIAALHMLVGEQCSAFLLENIALRFSRDFPIPCALTRDTDSAGSDGAVELSPTPLRVRLVESGRGRGRWDRGAHNSLLLLAYLYVFGVVHCALVYDVVRSMAARFSTHDVELLLLLLRHVGHSLRADDAAALRDIVLLVQQRAKRRLEEEGGAAAKAGEGDSTATVAVAAASGSSAPSFAQTTAEFWKARARGEVATNSAAAAAGAGADTDADGEGEGEGEAEFGGARIRFMLDTIYDLKNNRVRKAAAAEQDRSTRLKKWLGHLASKRGGKRPSLRISWYDLMHAEEDGRWWVVGARWVGRQMQPQSKAQQRQRQLAADGSSSSSEEEEGANAKGVRVCRSAGSDALGSDAAAASPQLLALAKAQGMNTDIRRSVFLAIMGAADFEDAFERCMKLRLQNQQEREIMRVCVSCCANEAVYNPFYAHLAHHLCSSVHSFKFTAQLTFWDRFRTLPSSSARAASNLARMLAHLVAHHSLSLGMLKVVEFASLSPRAVLFFSVLFTRLLVDYSHDEVFTIFTRISAHRHGNNAQSLVHRDEFFLGGDEAAASDARKARERGVASEHALVRDGIQLFLHRHLRARARTKKPNASAAAEAQRVLLRQRLKFVRQALDSAAVGMS